MLDFRLRGIRGRLFRERVHLIAKVERTVVDARVRSCSGRHACVQRAPGRLRIVWGLVADYSALSLLLLRLLVFLLATQFVLCFRLFLSLPPSLSVCLTRTPHSLTSLNQVKFWDFEVANGNLGLVHTRSLKVTDDVLCVRYSRHKQQSKLLLAGTAVHRTPRVYNRIFGNFWRFCPRRLP